MTNIPRKLQSGQRLNSRHWGYRQIDRKLWYEEMFYGIGEAKGREARKVQLIRVLGKGERKYDDDNLAYGSCKQIIDALVRLGWAKDDKDLPVEYDQVINRKEGPWVTVKIYEAADLEKEDATATEHPVGGDTAKET